MSPIQFIGTRAVLDEGKFLMELLCQLRRFGVGRLVYRHEWLLKYGQTRPSFVRVKAVNARMDRWLRHGLVWGEWTLAAAARVAGHPLGVYKFSGQDFDRPDWRLVHRHQEFQFIEASAEKLDVKRPKKLPLPPLISVIQEGGQYLESEGDISIGEITLEFTHFAKEESKIPNVTKSQTEMENVPTFDSEHRPLADLVEFDDSNKTSQIYDSKWKKVYGDVYGEKVPFRIASWGRLDDA